MHHKCDICSFNFCKPQQLKLHKKTVHGIPTKLDNKKVVKISEISTPVTIQEVEIQHVPQPTVLPVGQPESVEICVQGSWENTPLYTPQVPQQYTATPLNLQPQETTYLLNVVPTWNFQNTS